MSYLGPSVPFLTGDTPVYEMSSQEKLFIDGVVNPVIRSTVVEAQASMEEDLSKEFSLVCTELRQLGQEVVRL